MGAVKAALRIQKTIADDSLRPIAEGLPNGPGSGNTLRKIGKNRHGHQSWKFYQNRLHDPADRRQ